MSYSVKKGKSPYAMKCFRMKNGLCILLEIHGIQRILDVTLKSQPPETPKGLQDEKGFLTINITAIHHTIFA